ncbi:MAG: ATP synthase F1 subunit epsilon [Akkermansia sp.]|nr:ATP synthase F1 subunit epsilon [Akkermansia sp.]
MPLHFQIITPLRTALQADVSSIQLPAIEGEMEILPGHADIIAAVANGELTYRPEGGSPDSLFVGGGFLQVEKDNVLLVTDTALKPGEIDSTAVQAAIERAQAALRNSESVLSREEQTYLAAQLAKQLAILDYSRKRKSRV